MKKGIKFRTFAGILAWIIAMGTFPPAVSGAEEIETEPTSEIEEIYEEAEPVEAEFFWDEPVETEPEETESEVIEPEETEYEEIEPEETESEVIEPEETESEVIEPEETGSEEIEPEETGSEEIEPEEETQPEVIPEVTLYEQLLLSETLTAMYELLTAEENAEILVLLTEEEVTELIAKADDLYNTVFAIDPMNAELALSAEIISVLNGLPNAPVAVTEEIPVEIVNVQEKMAEFATAVALFPNEADFILYDEENDAEIFDEEAYYAAYAAFYEENPDIWMTTDALFAEAEAAYAEENPDGDIDAWMQDNGFWEAAEKFYWVVPTPDAVAEKTAQMEEVELEFTEEEEAPVFDSVKNALYEYRFKMYAYDENVYAQDEVVETYEADGITPEAFLNVYVEWTTLTAEEIDALTVSVVELYDETYDQMVEYALERYGEEELYKLRAYEVNFLLNGEPVDMTANPMTMEVELLNYERESMTFAMAEEEEPAPEAEVGTILSTLTLDETGAPVEVGSVFVEEGAEEETATLMSFTATSSNVVVYANSTTANPSFTVQYYANLEVISDTGITSLEVIDTSDGVLPTNEKGGNQKTKNIYLNKASGASELVTNTQLSPVYSEHDYTYIVAPNLSYFNRLYENGNYSLKQIWILRDGKSSDSTTESDWNIYTEIKNIHFTNRADHPGLDENNKAEYNSNLVLIKDNTVIRLIYDTTDEDDAYTNNALFYDYNISDGKYYKSNSLTGETYTTYHDTTDKVYIYTLKSGINSNYSGNGSYLAFGNSNAGSGYNNEYFPGSSYYINRYNESGYEGCVFGLAKSLDSKGNIIYVDGLSTPNLFNDGAANGKFEHQYGLLFNRNGDTYTLTEVSGTVAKDLEYLSHPGKYNGTNGNKKIWTNHFWPMDSIEEWGKNGRDVKFGENSDDDSNDDERFWFNDSETLSNLPPSDDGLNHNSYFGMQYAVQFTLSPDYIGPLDYLFFGDDDMWVFLDDKLVCDIGGVHSSVGQYINLWDYIEKEGRTEEKIYTLSFFYTERGASGSTCYMRFTLPSVSCATPEMNTGTLRIEKQVESPFGLDGDFKFEIILKDSDGNELYDDYSYTKFFADGRTETDIIVHTGDEFTLRDGEYIIIKYLPVGTQYSVKEIDIPEEFTSTYVSINGDEREYKTVAEGDIPDQNKTENVLYVNVHHVMVDTGITLDYLPYIILFSIVGTGVILTASDKRRRTDED